MTAARPSARGRVMLAFATFGVWWGGWGALLPAVQRSAKVDDGQLGLALLCIGAGALAAMRLTGHLVDRIGGRVLPLSVVAFGLAGTLPGAVRGVAGLALACAVLGAMSGAYDVAINAEAGRVEQATECPLLDLAHAAFSFGVIAGSLGAGGLRTAGASLTGALVVLGTVLAVVGALLSIGAPGRPERKAAVVAGVDVARRPWWRPRRELAVLGGLLALAFLVESSWQTWAAVHLERDLGASAGLAAVGPAVFGGAAGVGRLLVHRGAVPGQEARLVAGGAWIAVLATVAAALVPSTPFVLAGIAFAGIGTAAAAPSLVRLAGRVVDPAGRGAAVGTVTTIGYLGFVLAPALVGAIAGAASLPVALALVALSAVVLAVGASRLA